MGRDRGLVHCHTRSVKKTANVAWHVRGGAKNKGQQGWPCAGRRGLFLVQGQFLLQIVDVCAAVLEVM
ncbi:hypothetical protein CDT93_21790, partial [Cronobacter sakazakii]